MRIRYLLLNAYGGGGTIRTTLSMASVLAERGHDVEVASVTQRRLTPRFPVSPKVRLASLTRPGASRARRARERRCGAPGAAWHHPNDRLGKHLTRAHDHWLRRYITAQDDCVVVGTRMTLNLALADLRTDRQVAVAQEHNHLAKAEAVRTSYAASYPATGRRRHAHRGRREAVPHPPRRHLSGRGRPQRAAARHPPASVAPAHSRWRCRPGR